MKISLVRCALAFALALAGPSLSHAEGEGRLRPAKLAEIDTAVNAAIAEGRLPGGVLWIEHRGAVYKKAYGSRAVQPQPEATSEDTIYDLASLTKVIATTSAVMKLVEAGRINLEAPVQQFLPSFTGAGKGAITVRQLLTHTSGLRAGLSPGGDWSGADGALHLASIEPLPDPPGTKLRYSDINFILLGELVRAVAGEPLDRFCTREIFQPLRMVDTRFGPLPERRARVAPTVGNLRGEVHDPTARRMGGIAGHAGLFSAAGDVARFARMLLKEGELEGVRIFKPETVRQMIAIQTPAAVPERRGLGWDVDSPYAGPRGAWFPAGSYGHTGWTGTSLWLDPFSQSFVIFLSNRNHPTESGNVLPLRRLLGTLAAEAIETFNFVAVPGTASPKFPMSPSDSSQGKVRNSEAKSGIDVLAADGFKALQLLRVALVTNHTGIDRNRTPTIDLLHKAPGVDLVVLFSPEHGIRGVLDAKIGDSKDEKTGLPIYSLYGERRTPSADQLAGCDAIVFDIQDIGCRFYTYVSTLGECMVAAAANGKKVIVLDRPNPIGGAVVDGPVLAAERSFVLWHEIPLRHGMSVGELARMFKAERVPNVDLTVIPCEGWSRDQWFDRTGLPWINPSPNMRSLSQAVLYPGVGLLEFCNVSVGRGTDRPFEYLGAPYIDDRKLTAAMNGAGLSGIAFVPVRFTPKTSVFANQECGGVEMIVTDRNAFSSVDLGITLATILHRMHPAELKLEKMSRLLGHPLTLDAIRAGKPLAEIQRLWIADRESFDRRRSMYLLY